MSGTILFIDDDRRLLSLVENYLSLEGYRVLTAITGDEALRLARQEPPQVMILDPIRPTETDCRIFLDTYQRERPLPILLLTAHPEDAGHVTRLGRGVVAYLTKPFRPRKLLAHIHQAFRKAGEPEIAPRVIEAAGIVLDKGNRFVRIGPRYVDLTPSEFDVLAVFMSSPGCVISRHELLDVDRVFAMRATNCRTVADR